MYAWLPCRNLACCGTTAYTPASSRPKVVPVPPSAHGPRHCLLAEGDGLADASPAPVIVLDAGTVEDESCLLQHEAASTVHAF